MWALTLIFKRYFFFLKSYDIIIVSILLQDGLSVKERVKNKNDQNNDATFVELYSGTLVLKYFVFKERMQIIFKY